MPREYSDKSTALGSFLRARRDRLRPSDVGLPTGAGVRRTPGLRREELAAIAGVSVDYYTRLERGKESRPSASVVDALARALRLDVDEIAHLRDLASAAHHPPAAAIAADSLQRTEVSPATRVMLEQVRPSAAYVANRVGDILAATPSGLRLLPGIEDWEPEKRNISRYVFLHPAARGLFDDWDDHVTSLVADLRSLAGTEPDDPDLTRLVGELLVKSPDFARVWDRYDVRRRPRGTKVFHHPEVGDVRLTFQSMRLDGTPGQQLMIYAAEPGTPSHEALTLLDALGSEHGGPWHSPSAHSPV